MNDHKALSPKQGCRVVMLLDNLNWGGVQRVFFELGQEFLKRGVHVDFAICEPKGNLAKHLPADAQVFQLTPSSRWLLHLETRLSALRADPHAWQSMLRPVLLAKKPPGCIIYLSSFVQYLRRQKPAAILAAGRPLNIMSIWARILAQTPSRLVISEHVAPSQDLGGSRKWGRRYLPNLMNHVYPMADSIVAVSNGVAEDLSNTARIPRKIIDVIYNPIVNDKLLERAHAPIKHPWFRTGEPPVILGAGRLVPQKDFETLIRAFGLVRRQRRARLVILGEAKDESTTKAQQKKMYALARKLGMEEDVDFPGYVDNVPAFMARAGLFVLSSRYEGFGNVLVEALSVGCPVVSTKCPSGPSEILENGRWGMLTPVGDHKALARAINKTLDNPPDQEDLKQRSKHFSSTRAATLYLKHLLPNFAS